MKLFNMKYVVIFIIVALAGAGGWWLAETVLEWEKPEITLDQPVESIGLQKALAIRFIDRKSGLNQISAALWQDNKKYAIFSYAIPQNQQHDRTIKIDISPRDLKLHDGEAILELTATDRSWLKNSKTVALKITIDLMPPQIALMSAAHNINPGGTCLAVYSLSKPVSITGVQVDGDLTPSYSAVIGGKSCYISYFPIPSEVSPSTKMNIYAEDKAGNKTIGSIPFYIRNVKPFRTDAVNLADTFLDQKMPEFQQNVPSLRGKTPLETFVAVNEKLREENFKMMQDIAKKTDPKQLWEGTFLRMKNAAPMALFGDKRTYVYKKSAIGTSTHMGVDLASTQNAPVEAANNGIVVYTGYLGIYGNTVMIDHGVGIFSHYSHLNAIAVKVGQKVSKGDQIGASGATGLAGGDHLHFGMLVGHKFVNPIEWWDPHWIQDNVEKKLKGDFSNETPVEKQAAKPESKVQTKKHKKAGKKHR